MFYQRLNFLSATFHTIPRYLYLDHPHLIKLVSFMYYQRLHFLSATFHTMGIYLGIGGPILLVSLSWDLYLNRPAILLMESVPM